MYSYAIHTLSNQLTHTLRSVSEGMDSKNARLLTQAGFISRAAAGIYTLMPLAVRVLGRIETIIREEMNSLGAHELLVSGLQPRELWERTGRWDSIDVLYRFASRHGAEYCLSATAEEPVVAACTHAIRSYRDLPLSVYQISPKYRDEHRARAGMLRGREFRMKDLYSFHLNDSELNEFYESVCKAYARIFDRCGIGKHTVRTFASGGVFSRFSDEFQLLHESGEDTILITEDGRTAVNTEIAQDSEALRIVFGDKIPTLIERRAIEVGNTFKLGTRYTDALGLRIQDHAGVVGSVRMCSYGIGTTRLLASIAEVYGDECGLVWPQEVAPYDLHVVQIGEQDRSSDQLDQIKRLCTDERISTLLDLREGVRPGEKFATADLIGIPLRVVVGGARTSAHTIEVKDRLSGALRDVSLTELVELVKKR